MGMINNWPGGEHVSRFRKASKVYVLQFDGDLEGLEVRAGGASVDELMQLLDLASLAEGRKVSATDVKEIDALFDLFGSKVISWNLDDDAGDAVQPSAKGLRAQDLDFAMSLVLAWIDAVIGVSDPLDESSKGGAPLVEESIPMDVL